MNMLSRFVNFIRPSLSGRVVEHTLPTGVKVIALKCEDTYRTLRSSITAPSYDVQFAKYIGCNVNVENFVLADNDVIVSQISCYSVI